MSGSPSARAVIDAYALRLYPEAQADFEQIIEAVPSDHDPDVPREGLCCAGCAATRHYEAAAREAAAGNISSAQRRQAVGDAWYERARLLREGLQPREHEAER